MKTSARPPVCFDGRTLRVGGEIAGEIEFVRRSGKPFVFLWLPDGSKVEIPQPKSGEIPAKIKSIARLLADTGDSARKGWLKFVEWFVSSVLGGMVALIFVWFFSWEIGELIAECRKILGK